MVKKYFPGDKLTLGIEKIMEFLSLGFNQLRNFVDMIVTQINTLMDRRTQYASKKDAKSVQIVHNVDSDIKFYVQNFYYSFMKSDRFTPLENPLNKKRSMVIVDNPLPSSIGPMLKNKSSSIGNVLENLVTENASKF